MPITVGMTTTNQAKVNTTNTTVQKTDGGGVPFTGDIIITFDDSKLTYVANSADPAPTSTTSGAILWQNFPVPQAGMKFVCQLTCKEGASESNVNGVAIETSPGSGMGSGKIEVGCSA